MLCGNTRPRMRECRRLSAGVQVYVCAYTYARARVIVKAIRRVRVDIITHNKQVIVRSGLLSPVHLHCIVTYNV